MIFFYGPKGFKGEQGITTGLLCILHRYVAVGVIVNTHSFQCVTQVTFS